MKEKNIKLIYHSNYWDGPLSGACLYGGQRYWFNCVHDYHDSTEEGASLDMRIYGVYELTAEEWEHEDYWHHLFVENVGSHTSYDENGNRKGQVGPSKDHHKFYDAAREARTKDAYKKKDLTDTKCIGYFDYFEKVMRDTKYRNYWTEGESPASVHKRLCPNFEFIEWRNDAKKFDECGSSDFDGITSGWSVCIQPDGPEEGKAFWLNVQFCPWCGQEFKEKGVINGLSFEQKLDAEEKRKEDTNE